MKISNRFRELRATLGLTIPAAADKFSIPAASWKVYEKGSSEPGSCALKGLANGGVNINWMLTGKGAMFVGGDGDGDFDYRMLANALADEVVSKIKGELRKVWK